MKGAIEQSIGRTFTERTKKFFISINRLLSYGVSQRAKHDYEDVFLKGQRDIVEWMQCPLAKASILVLGCGYHYPEVILFSNTAQAVVGLDAIGAFYRDSMIKTFRDAKNREGNIANALLKKAVLERCGSYIYYRCLEKISGVPINHQKYMLLTYDGYQMPFRDETFDVVLSNAVVEHVKNLERVFEEVHRVTKKEGISYHVWHNYFSFSGGHVLEPLCLKYPWGHLRGRYKVHGLNKLTPSEIQICFSMYFDVIALFQLDKNNHKKGIDNDFRFEAEELLSESIRNELQSFPLELLLTRAYLIIGKKKDKHWY